MPNESLLLASTDGAEQIIHGGSRYLPLTHVQQKLHVVPYYWDPVGLTYVVAQQAAGGGSGGAVTVANGADVAQGNTADVAWTSGSGSVVAVLKAIAGKLAGTLTTNATVANFPATQPVSLATAPTTPITAAALPLPAGAATESGHLATIDTSTARIPAQGQALAAASLPVVLPAAQVTTLTPLSSVGVNNFPATQAVSLATNTPDVTDRATRLLGIVKAQDSAGNALNASGPGFLRTTDEPRQMFYDPFDGAVVDVTNRWTASFGLGAAVTPSQSGGSLTVNAGATATGWASLASQMSLTPTVPSWLGTSAVLSFTDGAAFVSTGYRFFGVGTIPGTPTVSAPITDGVGFDINAGKLCAVVWASGVRTQIADLTTAGTAPTDTSSHRYIVMVRTDKTFWYIDNLTTPVATSNFQYPSVQTLPVRYLAVSGGSATAITSAGVAAWDTGKNSTQLSDGTYAWRKATINAAGALSVALATNTPDVTDRAGRLVGVVSNANIDVALSTRLKPADTLAGVTTVAAVTAITNALPVGANKIGTVDIATAPAVAKGTQGANAVPTQDLKDSGRVAISFTAEFSPAAVAEAMLTMSVSKDGATASTGTSYVITSGKRLRIASKSIAVENTLGTSIQRAYLRTRFAATGGALIASPLQANICAAAPGTVKSIASNFDDYPDGMEFLGDGVKAIGWSLQAPDWVTASATLKVYVTIICFEY